MIEVIPGIYQIKLPLPSPEVLLGYVNAYLVQGDSGYLLVDTGLNSNEAFESFKKQLAEIGIGVENISRIIVTHIHSDHYGMTGKLKRLSQAEVYLHYLEKDLIESRYVNMDDLLQQIKRWLHINGVPPDELTDLQKASLGLAKFVDPTYPDVTLRGGETISTGIFNLQVLRTPGHSSGHVSLYEPAKKLFFSGDFILPTITPNISLHPQSSANPLGDYINALDTVKQLDVDLVLPGHENPFTGLESRIDEIIQHHQQRNSEILEVMKAEPQTAYQIAKGITWLASIGGVSWQSLSPLNKRLAVLETLAHIESMRADNGIVRKFPRNSMIYYQRT